MNNQQAPLFKELDVQDKQTLLMSLIVEVIDYFGQYRPDQDVLHSQSSQLEEDLRTYPSLTIDDLTEAIKWGRQTSTDLQRVSPRQLYLWVQSYILRKRKTNEVIVKNSEEIETSKVSLTQRKAWVVSGFRQYIEVKCDVSKVYDFGSVTYNSIYNFLGFSLTEQQRKDCINKGNAIDIKDMFEQSTSKLSQHAPKFAHDRIYGNPGASIYACKIFYDQYKNEEELRKALNFFEPVHEDHFEASFQYMPWVKQMRKSVTEKYELQAQSLQK